MEAALRRDRGGHPRRYLALPVLAVFAALLPACVIWPHTSEDLPAVHGQVVDATTLQPVPGARIAFKDHPSTTTTSDASGCFRFRKQKNFYLGMTLGMCPGDWPDREGWSTVFDITHPDYEPFHGYVETEPSAPTGGGEWTLREIRLTPKQR